MAVAHERRGRVVRDMTRSRDGDDHRSHRGQGSSRRTRQDAPRASAFGRAGRIATASPAPRHGRGLPARDRRCTAARRERVRALGPRCARPRDTHRAAARQRTGRCPHPRRLRPHHRWTGGNHLLRPARPAGRHDRAGECSPRRRLGCRARPRDGRRLLARRDACRTRGAISRHSMVDAGGMGGDPPPVPRGRSAHRQLWSVGATSTPTPTWPPAATSSIHQSHRTPPRSCAS